MPDDVVLVFFKERQVVPCKGQLCGFAQADVETKLACSQVSACLRNILATAVVWTNNVRLDIHDSMQLLWLERHFRVMQTHSSCCRN
jgi:hypothetical protein